MFTKIILDYKMNLFPDLIKSTDFEDITNGRKGAILVDPTNNLIPLVRTTTKYTKPAQKFKSIHYDIINEIKKGANINEIKFNNVLIEVYDNKYTTMGFHSDQSLDLENGSYIAIYSCYENIKGTNYRNLIVKNKVTNELTEFIMEHNSVILFDFSTNQQYLHKIILKNNNINNRWLGITFRLSKTFIHHINNIPYFYKTDNVLMLANNEECKDFYKLRGKENKSLEFKYPDINFTISASDLIQVV